MYIWDVENKTTYNNRMGRYKTKREFDFITRHTTKGFMNILDIGGGSGRFAIPLHENGHKITVIDKNDEALKILQKRCSEIYCINDEFLNAAFDDNIKYEIILSMEVLLYIEDWDTFFRKVHNLLDDNGIFIFTATNRSSWRTLLGKSIKHSRNNGYYEYTIMSSKEYSGLIKQTSFKTECVNGFSWIPCKLDSNSALVGMFSLLERIFLLKHYISQSPWLLYAVKKR